MIINTNDPISKPLADYYASVYGIPEQRIFEVDFPVEPQITKEEFEAAFQKLQELIPESVQALLLVWKEPYRVDCMSVTSAFAFGFNRSFCAPPCETTLSSPYFDSGSSTPYSDLAIRPTMLLAAGSLAEGRSLIDRGHGAYNTNDIKNQASAYLVTTNDIHRNVRAKDYEMTRMLLGSELPISIESELSVINKQDVLFLFTGSKSVEYLDSLSFVPGAIADHLTSSGGKLTEITTQMAATEWIKAGATGSYGTVVEPCSFTQKFPDPYIVINRYLAGETLIEAYWKSVEMPGQGLFIGDPLAAPYRNQAVHNRTVRNQSTSEKQQ